MKKKFTTFKCQFVRGLESMSQQERSVSGLTDNSFVNKPAETYDIPDNSILTLMFKQNHPHIYQVMQRKLWKDYRGLR
jgi:hypothetical protein